MSEERILVLTPLGRDGPLARSALGAKGFEAHGCAHMQELCDELEKGAGAVLLTEEALAGSNEKCLVAALESQPPWSDVPIIVFGSRELTLGASANLTLLDRPVRMRTLLSAVRAALRARRRQYQVRDLLSVMEQSVKDRDQFLAMLGHELRNPLAAIVTASELMEKRGGDAFRKERGVIHRQARHLARLVDDLLDVSRITRGKIVLHEEAFDLRELVRLGLQGVEKAAQLQGLKLRADFANTPVVVRADTLRAQQVVGNLLNNAVKYTNAGGTVEVSVRARDGSAVLCVRDTGVGISPEMLPRVFDLFSQAPGALDRAQGGMGIGLTLVKRLVELHGGSVEAQSDGLGLGSTFTARFPLAAAQTLSRPASAPYAATRDSLRVVVAEDNADARDVLQLALEQLGHNVQPCGDGTAAIARAKAEQPDAMIVDLGLPGADGYAVARAVRDALGPAVRLVALTGYGQSSDRERALDAGFDVFLVKPVEIEAIDRALRSLAG